MKKIIFALLALLSTNVFSATAPIVTVNWSRPTLNTDGSAITSPITYQLYVGTAGHEVIYKTPVTSPPYILVPTPAPGSQVCVQVTATADSVESAPSAEICKTLPKSTPNAPTAVTITIS